MRHNKSGRKFGMTPSHRKAVYRNMADSLIIFGRIKTTTARAKEVRKLADRLITLAKEGSLQAKRKALTWLRTKDAFVKLFGEYAERFKDRDGGYTRIIKSSSRPGDNAPMAFIEYLSTEDTTPTKPAEKTTEKKKRRS